MACPWAPAPLCWRLSTPRGAARRWGAAAEGHAPCEARDGEEVATGISLAWLGWPSVPHGAWRIEQSLIQLTSNHSACSCSLPACPQVVGKPEASFFQLALSDMGCQPQDAVMIGELLRQLRAANACALWLGKMSMAWPAVTLMAHNLLCNSTRCGAALLLLLLLPITF